MSELLEKKLKFTNHFSVLIQFAIAMGYQIAFDKEHCEHMPASLHYLGLAKDILLYKKGVYLKDTADYRFLGNFWKSLDKDCRWGGDFLDGCHFSITYQKKA